MTTNNHGRYTHGHEASTLASHGTRTAANSAGYLLKHLAPGMNVLDVGCGPGTITLDLASIVSPGKVVGIEKVEAPLIAARAEAQARGDTATEFRIADVFDLPFADASFDIVHAHQVLQHLTDPVAALKEMARVCKPGGRVAARDADYAAMSWHPELPALELWRRTYRNAALANGAQPDAGRRLREWAQAANLATAEIRASVWAYTDAPTCKWWGDSQAIRYSGDMFTKQAKEQGLSDNEIASIAQGWSDWGNDPNACFFMTHGELLAQMPLR